MGLTRAVQVGAGTLWRWAVGRVAGHDRRALIGVVGAMALVGGVGAHLALVTPPYAYADEQAHVGYVLVLRGGSLPTIDTPIPLGSGDQPLRARVEREVVRAPYRGNVYVANDPPLVHVLAVPVAEVLSWVGAPSPVLFALRLLNVAGAMAAVACTYLLARELSGRDGLVGLTAAGLVSATIGVGLTSSLAGLDGAALAATTGMTWALARAARSPTSVNFLHIGLWGACAIGVRPMSAAYAGVAAVLAVGLAWRLVGWWAVPRVGALVLGPAMVLIGWFYALNLHRYGDPTGSAAIFDRLDRTPGAFSADARMLGGVFRHLFTGTDVRVGILGEGLDMGDASLLLLVVSLLAVVGAIVLAVVRSRGRQPDGMGRAVPWAWVAVAVLAAVPIVLVKRHAASGGGVYPRYLFPLLPIVASALMFLARRAARWVPVAALAALAGWELSLVGDAVAVREGLTGFFGATLPPLVGSPIAVGICRGATFLGAALLLGSSVVLLVRPTGARGH